MAPPNNQPLQPWGSQQPSPITPHTQQSSQQQQQQAPVPNMSGPVPPHMSMGTMSPMQTPSPYTNPSSPWFSPQHQYGHPQMNARRNDAPMDFRYGQQQPQPGQPHHPGQGQPPMNVAPPHGQHPSQQHPQHPQAQQQQAPHPAAQQQAAPGAPPAAPTAVAQRQRKRPNPATAPATSASPIIPPPIPTGGTPATSNTAIPPPGTPGAQSTNNATPSSTATPNVAVKSLPADEVGAIPTPPPAKKSRTNTPWTPAEEHRLKQMRDAGNSWAEIAKTFPTRTEGSVKKHWYKDMHYAEFAEDESAALLNAIKEYETQKWKVIGQKVGKPAKACEQYAKEHFSEQVLASAGKR